MKVTVASSPSTIRNIKAYAMAVMNRNDSNSVQIESLISPTKPLIAHPDTPATGHYFAKLQGKEMQQ